MNKGINALESFVRMQPQEWSTESAAPSGEQIAERKASHSQASFSGATAGVPTSTDTGGALGCPCGWQMQGNVCGFGF